MKLIQSEEASSDPSVVHQAAEEMLAKFQHLQPGPVPQSTALCLTLAAIDNCGHVDISGHMNDAVCAGVEAGTTEAARDLLLEVQRTGAIPFDLIHDKSIQQTLRKPNEKPNASPMPHIASPTRFTCETSHTAQPSAWVMMKSIAPTQTKPPTRD